jgi:hypothetical protein
MSEPLDTQTANFLATGAPGSITLGGKTFIVNQPTEQDGAAIGLEIRKIAKRRKDAKFLELVREFKDVALAKTILAELCTADESENLTAAVADAEGCAFIAFILIRKGDPSVTLAILRELITEDNAGVIGMELLEESGLGKAVPNSPGASG